MAIGLLRRLAAARPAPVFVALGMHAAPVREVLALDPRVELVDSPRHASVLVVAGGVPPDQHEALRRIHDQLPRPSASLWLRSEPLAELPHAERIEHLDAAPEAIARLHRELVEGRRAGAAHLLPDRPPHPWQGLGAHGQGGEGMMGGNPYGRPMAMAMMQDLRDGLTLDSLSFTLGPFYPALPPGLQLQLTLQGDLVQMATIASRAYPMPAAPCWFQALERPVPIAELEIARARHHLHRLAHLLRLAELGALARRTLADAAQLQPGRSLPALRRRIVRSGLLQAVSPGVGRLDSNQAYALGGPASRATGGAEDARSEDPHYARLGFRPLSHPGGDVRARILQWVGEIEQALSLAAAAKAQALDTASQAQVETPRGAMRTGQRPADGSHLLSDLLPGREWSEALLLIASLDLAALPPYPEPAADCSARREAT